MRFLVKVPIECINGYVKKAHLEGYVEAESAEEAIKTADDDFLSVVVDKMEVYDYDLDWGEATATPNEEKKNER